MATPRSGTPGPAPPSSGDSWPRLREAHPDWLGRFPRLTPLYRLAEPIIARLESPRLGRPPLLDRRAAEAERALNRLCGPSRAVGVLDDLPISYPFLSPPPPPPSDSEMIAAGWTPAVRREMKLLARRAAESSVRLKGYAGWLLTEPDFLDACGDLSKKWEALPDGGRPRFPLRRGAFHPDLPEDLRSVAPGAGEAFGTAFFEFCERWGLAAMYSWDLPEPQGALLPNPLPPGAPALPRQGLHLYLPIHYPLTGDDELLARIFREQRALADQVGLPCSTAGLPHHGAYATILEVIHWERAIRSRFGPGRCPRGSVGFFKEAIAETIEISVDQVEKWRKAISACRRGKRHQVPALKIGI
jgi:hypothetical protein